MATSFKGFESEGCLSPVLVQNLALIGDPIHWSIRAFSAVYLDTPIRCYERFFGLSAHQLGPWVDFIFETEFFQKSADLDDVNERNGSYCCLNGRKGVTLTVSNLMILNLFAMSSKYRLEPASRCDNHPDGVCCYGLCIGKTCVIQRVIEMAAEHEQLPLSEAIVCQTMSATSVKIQSGATIVVFSCAIFLGD
jgi:hypothetical protein